MRIFIFILTNLIAIILLMTGCETRYDNQDATDSSRITTSIFLSDKHRYAYQYFSDDATLCKKVDEVWKKYYQNLVSVSDLSQYTVYEWYMKDNPHDQTMKVLKKKYIPELQAEIIIALQDDRLIIKSGQKNDKYGTFLTIIPKKNQNGWSNTQGNIYKNIFIEGLYEAGVPALFEKN